MADERNVALSLRSTDGGRPAYSHSGAGSLNVNAGAGVQKNYNQSGSGNRQFIADTIQYVERAETRPDYTGTYSYTSLQPVASYVARPELQRQVEERLDSACAVGVARYTVLILVGLGGAGKSQLALNYIHTHREDYSAVFWVDARLRESVERDFIQIHYLLYGNQQESAALQLDVDRVITAVKSWFQARKGRWLFVFDNADSLDDESDPYFVDLRRHLPDAPGVDVIVTTRSRTAVDMTELEAVEVGKLTPAEAVDIFVRCSKMHNPTADVLVEAGRIVTELDYLALAVTLAGAYVAATPRVRSNINEYLPEYRQRRKMLLNRKAKRQIHQYGESVLSTWETSCTAISKQCPVAVRLLSFMSFLDPEDIFLELFRTKGDSLTMQSEVGGNEWKNFLSPNVAFEEVVDEALEALLMYSLIQWNEEQGGYWMHKLVHTWGFDRLEENEQGEYSWCNLTFLERSVQERQLDPVTKSRMATHILSSVTRLREWHQRSIRVPERSLDLVWSLANFVKDTGQYHVEYELRSFDHVEREGLREKDEKGLLRSLDALAVVLWRQGKYEDAEHTSQRALEGREEVLGKEHPSTLTSVSNLALVLKDQGKYEAAEEMNRRALEGTEKVLGKEHPNTLTSVSNLALVLWYQGKYGAAEEMNRRVLEGYEKVLGKEHPNTLTSVNNLALVLQDQGKYEAAEEMNRRVLEGREKVLGKQHPATLICVWSRAELLCRLSRYDESILLYERASTGLVAALGILHPDTLECQQQFRDAKGQMQHRGN